MHTKTAANTPLVQQKKIWKKIKRSWQVYLLVLPPLIWFLVIQYWPLSWLRMVFYDFHLYKGFEGSKFVGLQNFAKLFSNFL